jgi:heme exporter protein A
VSSASSANFARGIAVEFQRVDKRYGMLFALRGLSLCFHAGECVALLGPNGSGKTTLLRIAALLARPTAGTLRFAGDGLAESGDDIPIRQRLGLVAHNTLLYDELTAEENLILFAKLYGLDRPRDRAVAALSPAGLERRGKSPVRTFSRGMRQRLAIARAMLPGPGLLLLDEPTTGLDAEGQRWFGELMEKLNREGCTIVMSTHARTEAHDVVTRALRLAAGQVQEDSGTGGDPRGVLAAALAARQED